MNYILGPDELQVKMEQEYNAYRISRRKSIDSERGWNRFRNKHWSGDNRAGPMYIVLLGQAIQAVVWVRTSNYNRAQPGNYSISSLATVYNALFLGGGPGKNESYRNIELITTKYILKLISNFWSMGISRKRRVKRQWRYSYSGLQSKNNRRTGETSGNFRNGRVVFWFIIICLRVYWVCLYSLSKCTSEKSKEFIVQDMSSPKVINRFRCV
jgi:hypothetical protein